MCYADSTSSTETHSCLYGNTPHLSSKKTTNTFVRLVNLQKVTATEINNIYHFQLELTKAKFFLYIHV